ncbi:MAG TPA: aminoglycoside phosphotransferase family protein [Rhizomicrobium sp.]|nr:aminoglycoside phosphotransferase family protein [Rhizomicrobium sp.]
MPTEGREPKPAWADVPAGLRERIAALIGEPIAGGEIAWGGYGPTASFVLTTVSGARHFCKGTHPGNTKEGHAAVLQECANLVRFAELARFGAGYRGMVEAGGWHLAVLEFVPRGAGVPPWTAHAVDQVFARIAEFHAATPVGARATLGDRSASDLLAKTQNWHSLRDPAVRGRFIALFEDAGAAAQWLDPHLDRLIARTHDGAALGGPQGWVHMDIRSDNMIFAADGRLLLVDWPVLSYGPQLLDVAFFLASLEAEGGPACAEGLRRYEAAAGVTFADDDIGAAATIVAGFFAARAGEPEVAALPRLRGLQKRLLFPALRWMCASLALPPLPRSAQA